jgi:CRP-like cAMP-binding protein
MADTATDFAAKFPALRETMSKSQLTNLQARLQTLAVAAGDKIAVAGTTNDSLYFIFSGTADIQLTDEGRVVTVGTLGPGQWFGEIGLVEPGPASADVRAREDCELMVLPQADYVALQKEDPGAASHLLQVLSLNMAARLRESANQLLKNAGEGQFQVETIQPDRPGWVRKLAAVLAGAGEAGS